MIEILEFYVSGFWVWAGLTIGLSLVVGGASAALSYIAALVRR